MNTKVVDEAAENMKITKNKFHEIIKKENEYMDKIIDAQSMDEKEKIVL